MTSTATIEPIAYERLLLVYLHDPLDKALNIPSHETRAARYASRARGWDATRYEIKDLAQPPSRASASN